MSQEEFPERDLKQIVKYLEDLSKKKKLKFMLATQTNHKKSELKISYSSQFSEAQRNKVYAALSQVHTNIASIKPTLKIVQDLKISRKSIKDLTDHYKNLLQCLSQAVCKEVAKQWIKIAEPNKQATFPYKNFNKSKPDWWPKDVNHIEPDHLDKYGRTEVLISILRNPHFSLEEMQRRTSTIKFKRELTQRVLGEVYYIAVYDRLFYNRFRFMDPLFNEIQELDKPALEKDYILIPVSKLKDSIGKGIVMVSRFKPSYINDKLFQLQGGSMTEKSISPDSTPEITPISSPVAVKPSSKRRIIRQSSEEPNEEPDKRISIETSTIAPSNIKIKKEFPSSVTELHSHSETENNEYENFFDDFKEAKSAGEGEEEEDFDVKEGKSEVKIELSPHPINYMSTHYSEAEIIHGSASDIFFHIDHYSSSSSETSYS